MGSGIVDLPERVKEDRQYPIDERSHETVQRRLRLA
jgi:hypothetical protein